MSDPTTPPEAPAAPLRPDGVMKTIRSAVAGASYDYTAGNIHRSIIMLAVPMILEMVMESTFAVVDVYFVARLGKSAVAAVGLTESLLTILYAVAIGLSMSVTATVARRIGERDPKGAAVAAGQAVALGVSLALIIGAVGWFGGRQLLALMGASEEVRHLGHGYTRLLLGTNIVIMLLFLNNAVFRGAGDASLAMRTLWLANGINIILDPCLIFGWGPFPEMGLTGAAVATTCGRGIGVLFQFLCLTRGIGRIRLNRAAFGFDPVALIKLVRISLGGIGQFLIATASWVMLVRIVSPFGDAALAGYTIGIRILIFTFLPAWGLSNAAATLTGQNLGAGNPDRAARGVVWTGIYTMSFLAVVAAIMLAIPEVLVGVFTNEPAVVTVAVNCLKIVCLGYVFYGWGMVTVQAFNGAGDTVTPTWINFFCFWMVEIPLAWTLARHAGLGPNGVFWAVAISESLLAVVGIFMFRRGRWKTRVV